MRGDRSRPAFRDLTQKKSASERSGPTNLFVRLLALVLLALALLLLAATALTLLILLVLLLLLALLVLLTLLALLALLTLIGHSFSPHRIPCGNENDK